MGYEIVDSRRVSGADPLGITQLFGALEIAMGGDPSYWEVRIRDTETRETFTGTGNSREDALEKALSQL